MRLIIGLIFFIAGIINCWAQQISFKPEMVLGHRSFTYQHIINYSFNEKIKINNLILYDTEYKENKNNIFFIRNTLAYYFQKHFSVNGAIGIKNPGSFASLFLQYQYNNTSFLFAYAAGSTYQNGFTLEQSLLTEITPKITDQLRLYIRLQAIGNINSKEYQRGFQQIRFGLKSELSQYGVAANFDQFNNAAKTLKNIGIFYKYNFS